MLFDLWFDQPQRPTRDIDLLGFGHAGLEHLINVFKEICSQACDDGIAFDQASVRASDIRKEANCQGVRVTMLATLDGARCAVQVDVGYGDAVTPAADDVVFPVLLDDMPQPLLHSHPVYTVVAEKYHAMVSLGIANTRMKDYFVLWILARHAAIDRTILNQAIEATFQRRATAVPVETPHGLSIQFAIDPTKQRQWRAFLSKNKLEAPELVDIVIVLQALLGITR